MDLDALLEQEKTEEQKTVPAEVVAAPEVTIQTPTITEQPSEEIPQVSPAIAPNVPMHHTSHTFEDDLSKALDTTDATTVQTLLNDARDREEENKQREKAVKERRWYTSLASVLIIGTLVAGAFSIFYFKSLTVPVKEQVSIGVFPTTASIAISNTDIRQLLTTLATRTDIPEQKAILFNLVANEGTTVPLTDDQTIAFSETKPSEPLRAVLQNIHLGVYNTGTAIIPFVVAGVTDPEIASKELLVGEPSLLQQFYTALGINPSDYTGEVGNQFTSSYTSNLPVRSLLMKNTVSQKEEMVLLYGYATDHILVITTHPEALKAIYETVIKQY